MKHKMENFDTRCPCCSRKLNAARNADESHNPPMLGDLSICAECGQLLLFGPNRYDAISPEALADLADKSTLAQLINLQAQIKMANAKKDTMAKCFQ